MDRDKRNIIIKKYTDKIKKEQCIIDHNGKNIIGDFILKKRIGTNSKYGHVYKMILKNKYNIAIKITYDREDSNNELKIINEIKKKKFNIHFPIIYTISYCNIFKIDTNWFVSQRPTSSSSETFNSNEKQNYNIIFNELAECDLKQFLKKNTFKLEFLTQIILSILSLHNIGYQHNDTHYGNFLIYKNTNGYIHYIIDNKDLFLNNYGYIFVIWDFGMSSKFKNSETIKKTKYYDYLRISNILDKYVSNIKIYNFNKFIHNLIINTNFNYEPYIINFLITNKFFNNEPPINSNIINRGKPIILNTK